MGGANNNYGVIFSFDLSTHTYSDIHDFDSLHGSNPMYGSLLLANDGKLYGTTSRGGIYNNGIIFRYDTALNTFSVVYDFDSLHGGHPYGSLIQATDGKFYGMTFSGGLSNKGVIYNYNISDSTYNDIHDFDSIHGANPQRELMQASNGILYGVTCNGGTVNDGVFFSYNIPTNTYTMLYNFDGVKGSHPQCDILEIPDNLTTGIKSISNKESITIYPNPASTFLTINNLPLTNNELRITDVLGNEVYHQAINNSTQTSINISQWSDGVYFYSLTPALSKGEGDILRGKFVKE
jgi:uncharacterized repeat protein (TIGR03803 family)